MRCRWHLKINKIVTAGGRGSCHRRIGGGCKDIKCHQFLSLTCKNRLENMHRNICIYNAPQHKYIYIYMYMYIPLTCGLHRPQYVGGDHKIAR